MLILHMTLMTACCLLCSTVFWLNRLDSAQSAIHGQINACNKAGLA